MLAEKICLILGLALVGSVIAKSFLMSQRGTRAIVFGKTDRADSLLIPFMLGFIYLLCAQTFDLSAPAFLVARFWGAELGGGGAPITAIIGIALCVAAVIGLIATLISFGTSFRVGIDEQHPSKLITAGVFSKSRNPIYVCFGFFLVGLVFVFASPLVMSALILLLALFHRQVLKEEAFLRHEYGEAFEEYCQKVPRYL